MAAYYYLISSLPMLDLDSPVKLDSSAFIELCRDFLPENELEIISSLKIEPNETSTNISELEAWKNWETQLRNSLVKYRGKEANINVNDYLREERDYSSEIEKGVVDAYSKSNPLEREDHLDKVRWSKLEGMEVGHDFDFLKLCLYKLKLLICEKRNKYNLEKGSQDFDEVIAHIYEQDSMEPLQIED